MRVQRSTVDLACRASRPRAICQLPLEGVGHVPPRPRSKHARGIDTQGAAASLASFNAIACCCAQAAMRPQATAYRGVRMMRVLCLLSLVACAPVAPNSRVAPAPGMVLITPDYLVVRDGVVLPLHTPVSFSTQFLAQQRAAFGADVKDQRNRMLRYELGKIEHHDPLAAFGTVSEDFTSTPGPATIEFGQPGVTDRFGDGGKSATTHLVDIAGREVKHGNSLAEDVAELQSGRMKPDDLPIHVFHYVDLEGQPHWVTENNRALTVFRMAKILPTRMLLLKKSDLEAKPGANSLMSVLNRLKALPGAKPSNEMFVRIAGVNDVGEPRQSWDWDAPFGFVVK